MARILVLLSFGLLLFAGVAAADYDDCVAQQERIYNDCMKNAENHVNDIEIQDAKEACNSESSRQRSACDDAEVGRYSGQPNANAQDGQ